MIQAILNGTKNQTRRIISNNILSRFDDLNLDNYGDRNPSYETEDGQLVLMTDLCPYGQVGDYTWTRETFTWDDISSQYFYKADNHCDLPYQKKWTPCIHMPRSACRIVRENIDIRVERVADISEEDAIGEGVELVNDSNCLWKDYELTDGTKRLSARSSYKSLWNSINNNPKLNKKTDTYIVYPFDKQSAAKWGNTYRNKPLIVVPNPWVWVVKFK